MHAYTIRYMLGSPPKTIVTKVSGDDEHQTKSTAYHGGKGASLDHKGVVIELIDEEKVVASWVDGVRKV